MTIPPAHRLEALEPDNLLAWLALLGLMRSLETAKPAWRPRACWAGTPLRPVLRLAVTATPEQVCATAAEGCAELAAVHEFGGTADLTFGRDQARRLLADAAATPDTPNRAALLDALFSDGAVKDDGTILATPLCAMFGQGHQHFLSRLANVPNGALPRALKGRKEVPDLNAPEHLAAALFAPWTRDDPTDGFRWDPAEDRRYALREKNPSTEAGTTQHGANRLAAVGLPVLVGAPVQRRGRVRFLVLGSDLDAEGQVSISWPIWRQPASLAAIRSLVGHPALVAPTLGDNERSALSLLGVEEVRRAQRISVGKYFNFPSGTSL